MLASARVTRDGDVLQTTLDEAEDLSLALLGNDVQLSRGDTLVYRGGIITQPEEHILFRNDNGRIAMIGTKSIHEIALIVELFAANAVETAIVSRVEILFAQSRQQRYHGIGVAFGCRPHERVNGDVERCRQRLESSGVLVDECPHGNATCPCAQDVLEC